jgi:hypothetical protein
VVYFIQATDEIGPIKIGTSEDVPARIRQLEATYNRPLAVLATMPGGRDEERAIHERFSHLRFGRTEQFQPDPDLLDFISRPLFVSACPVVEPMGVRWIPVKIDAAVLRDAKIAAAYKEMTLAEYLSESMRAVSAKDIQEEHDKRTRPRPARR